MTKDSNEEIRRKVMKGMKDPAKNNPEYKAWLKREDAKAKRVQKDLNKRKGKHTRRRDDGDGVVNTGMFDS